MSGFFGGGYPRGNPPNWDDPQDENQSSTSGSGGGGIFWFMLLMFAIALCSMLNQSKLKEDKAPCDYTVVSAGLGFSNSVFVEGKARETDGIYVQHVIVKDNIAKEELVLLAKYFLEQQIPDNRYIGNRVIRIGTNKDALDEAELHEERNSYTRDERAHENYEKCYLLKVIKYDFATREIRWEQKQGKFGNLYGTAERL